MRRGRVADETLSRRTVMQWLGRGAVLALGAPLLEACAEGEARPDAGPLALPDAGLPSPDAGGAPLGFTPGDGSAPIFSGWGERTVDRQDLARLLASWKLTLDGRVSSPRTFTFAELLGLPRRDQLTDFHCVEGWSVPDVPWNGVSLAELLDRVQPAAQATHLTFHTVGDRYDESLPLAVAREERSLLAFGVGGSTLPLAHGFPLRVVVPRLLGYKNAKYVYRVELTDHPVEGFWVAAGYPYAGEVPKSRLRDGHY